MENQVAEQENKLVQVVRENQLGANQGQMLLDKFHTFFKEASEYEAKAKAIVITDVKQVEKMQEAREMRLSLKDLRVGAEAVRKTLKSGLLREGKAIDGMANIIKALIVPIEEHLDKQEKFVENKENERKAKINDDRKLKLEKYVEDLSMYNYDCNVMTDEVFVKLLETVKTVFENKQAAIKKVEDERLANEKKEKAEQERIRLENVKLKKEKIEEDKKREKEKLVEEKKMKIQKAKLEKEEEAKKKLQDELDAKKADEEKAKKDDEAAKLKAEKDERLKPEKEKLIAYADSIKNVGAPADLSVAGKAIVDEAEKKLLAVSQEIKLKLKNL